MFRRSRLLLLCCALLPLLAFAQQRPNPPELSIPSTVNLTVRIMLGNEQPSMGAQFRVQLLKIGGVPVREVYADAVGQAILPDIQPGKYQLVVTSPQIEDSTSEIELSPMERMHFEDIRVKLRASAKEQTPSQGSVAATSLNIPEKALKEMRKGNKAVAGKDLDSAEKHYRNAIKEYPEYADAMNNLGVLCLSRKQFACARENLQKTVQLDPNSGHALLNLGRLEMVEGKPSLAEPLLQRAIALEPANPEALMVMAAVELTMRKYAEAAMYAQKVHTIPHQGFGMAHWIAARALEAQGRPQEAVVEYRNVLQEAPQTPVAEQAREALARLEQNSQASAPRQ